MLTINSANGKKSAHLDVFGEISALNTPDAQEYGIVSLYSIKAQIEKSGGVDSFDDVVVHINSVGGEVTEGYAIYNYLKGLGKPITTVADGQVASIATVIFLSGDIRKAYPTTDFMIHNPWLMAVGDADQLEGYASELRRVEAQLIEFYANQTGADSILLETLMAEETHLTTNQLLELGFATEIIEPVKAFAKIIPTNNINQMNKKLSKVGKVLAEAWGELKRLGVPVNEMVMTADGQELEIDMGDATEPTVGNTVMLNGEPAPDGEYSLENGMKIVVTAGVISEVTPAEAVVTEETVASMKKEISDLKNQIANLTSENKAIEQEASEIVAHLKSLNTRYTPPRRVGAQVSTDTVKASTTPTKEDVKARINQLRKK